MVVIVLERVSAGLRGDLTRWMLELRPGTFVGKLNARVRDRVWERVCSKMRGGAAVLVHTAQTEQGFAIRFWGSPKRWPVDFEGLTLIQTEE
jgi:CRISPR-associated protein Cas2